jgi:hypothetical protein
VRACARVNARNCIICRVIAGLDLTGLDPVTIHRAPTKLSDERETKEREINALRVCLCFGDRRYARLCRARMTGKQIRLGVTELSCYYHTFVTVASL